MDRHALTRQLETAALAYGNVQPDLPPSRTYAIFAPNDVQCFLRREGEVLQIAFRGSNSLRDALTDLQFWKKCIPYDNTASKIRVHTGFINAYKDKAVRPRIQALVAPGVHRVRITGHSLGAALAVLCAVDLQYNFPDRDFEVALFGCPRVGNAAFRDSYNRRVFKTLRVQNGNDAVTKIPFAFMGYRHVGVGLHVGPPRIPGRLNVRQHALQGYYHGLLQPALRTPTR